MRSMDEIQKVRSASLTEQQADERALSGMQHASDDSELPPESVNKSNMVSSHTDLNFIESLRRRATSFASSGDVTIDNTLVMGETPKCEDMCVDTTTTSSAFVHGSVLFISFVCWIYALSGHQEAAVILGALCLLSNAFGIAHAAHSGSISRKAERLDAALQSLAQVITTFSKAISTQERYMMAQKKVLNYFDNLATYAALQRQNADPQAYAASGAGVAPSPGQPGGPQQGSWDEVALRTKKKIVEMHIHWLHSFFEQLAVLDNRIYMTPKDYEDFVYKLPRKTRKKLQASHHGLDARLETLDDDNSTVVLPYVEARKMIEKVVEELKDELRSLDGLLRDLPPIPIRRATRAPAHTIDVTGMDAKEQAEQYATFAALSAAAKERAESPRGLSFAGGAAGSKNGVKRAETQAYTSQSIDIDSRTQQGHRHGTEPDRRTGSIARSDSILSRVAALQLVGSEHTIVGVIGYNMTHKGSDDDSDHDDSISVSDDLEAILAEIAAETVKFV